ncbi:uncharacterized protein [Miscanthus floridulus]|uniref:uncharacterized protein n=1 Tax=Miscanthus floridulus TaxID=154761 RepID=UPI00345A6A8F
MERRSRAPAKVTAVLSRGQQHRRRNGALVCAAKMATAGAADERHADRQQATSADDSGEHRRRRKRRGVGASNSQRCARRAETVTVAAGKVLRRQRRGAAGAMRDHGAHMSQGGPDRHETMDTRAHAGSRAMAQQARREAVVVLGAMARARAWGGVRCRAFYGVKKQGREGAARLTSGCRARTPRYQADADVGHSRRQGRKAYAAAMAWLLVL